MLEEMKEMIAEQLNCEESSITEQLHLRMTWVQILWICLNW